MKPRIAVGSLGGTITMTATSPEAGIRPTLDAATLIDAVPALGEVAAITATTLLTSPGASLTFEQLKQALVWAKSAVAEGNDGVVIVQGTDTIEESSYFFDLYWDEQCPLVVTGAMRGPQQVGSDGPSNLLSSVSVAADPASGGRGVLVVMNEEIHAAARVRKVRSNGLAAFDSPAFGSLGYVEEGRIVYGNCPVRRQPLLAPGSPFGSRTALLETHLGDDGHLLGIIAKSGGFEGVVLAGFGVGHVSASLAKVVASVAGSFPLILTSRTGVGTTFTGTYGFAGSERDLISSGAIPSGWLDSRKSSVLLGCLLSAGMDIQEIRQEFASRGGLPAKLGNYVE